MEIVLENVSKELHHSKIINDISLQLESGFVYGLKGYNGSGKTMLLRLIAGLLRPTSGRVMIGGRELGREMDFPPSIGVLLENPAFLSSYTGYKNLKIIAELREKTGDEEIREALIRVGLAPDEKRKYRKYSLGMKQRLGIACAIFEHPDIILLDEPINALDSEGILLVNEIIREEKQRGALIVLTSHDGSWLEESTDMIYTIENGKIVL